MTIFSHRGLLSISPCDNISMERQGKPFRENYNQYGSIAKAFKNCDQINVRVSDTDGCIAKVFVEYSIILYIVFDINNCGAMAQSVTVKSTSCGFDPHMRK